MHCIRFVIVIDDNRYTESTITKIVAPHGGLLHLESPSGGYHFHKIKLGILMNVTYALYYS